MRPRGKGSREKGSEAEKARGKREKKEWHRQRQGMKGQAGQVRGQCEARCVLSTFPGPAPVTP